MNDLGDGAGAAALNATVVAPRRNRWLLAKEGTVSFGGYEPPAPPDEWNLTASRSAIGGESALTADDRGHDAADAADRGKRKAHKQHKHKHKDQRHANKHGRQ
jgi:hypothetical protein